MKRILIAFFLLSSAVFAEPFNCMVALTRQDPSLDWWYAVPQEFTPQLSQVSTVAKGEYFCIIPMFRNYTTDSNQEARISFDIEVIRPDASIDVSLDQCDGHQGRATPPLLLPSQAVLNLCFDPEDPYGEYKINVTAIDHVAGRTHIQSETIVLEKFTQVQMTEVEREDLFWGYATAPDPAKALSAYLQTEQSFFNEEGEPIWSAIWFFKTIFENNEYLIPHLLNEYASASRKQKRDIILVMALLDQLDRLPRMSGELKSFQRLMEAGRIPNPYDEITTGKQLDMLWAEFFATGTVKPIRQIVSSLTLVEHVGTIDKIKSGELDAETLEVYRTGILESVFQSALWSLRSNCKQSPLVFHYCMGILHSEDLDKPAQSCLSMLLQSINSESSTPLKPKDEK